MNKEFAFKKENIITGLLLGGIILFLFMIAMTNICHYTYRLDADISSEVVLGREIWDMKQIVPDTWYISSEARIIGPLDFAALFYGLTHNMVLAMGLACCVMTLLITFSMFYFGKSLGLKLQDNLLFVFLGLAIPVLFDFLDVLYLFACYYASHVVNIFLVMGVYAAALKEKRIQWCGFVLSLLLAVGLGMQGVRGMLVLYGPLFGMELIRNLYRLYCRKKADKTDKFVSLWVTALLVLNFIGTLFPVSIDQEMSRNIRNGFKKLFTVVIPNMEAAVGLNDANPAEKIALVFMLAVVIILVGGILWRMIHKKEIEAVEWAYLVICASPVITALMLAFTTIETTERYYFMLVYTMAFAATLAFHKLRRMQSGQAGKIVRILLSLSIVVITISNLLTIYLPIMKEDEPPLTKKYEVARYLEENGFQRGYASFAHANNLTVLTNGKVRMASVASLDKMNVCKWLTSSNWYVPNVPYEAETAYVVYESEMPDFEKFLAQHGEDMRFETQIGNFYIYSSDYNFSNFEN